MTNFLSSPSRDPATTLTTSGMTSPARRTYTRSPIRMALRPISSALCRGALATTTPPTLTGSSRATGVSAPVLPTCTSISSTLVISSRGGYLQAIGQRGARDTEARRLRALPVPQGQRHGANGPYIGGDVLAPAAIAAGGGAQQSAVLIEDT